DHVTTELGGDVVGGANHAVEGSAAGPHARHVDHQRQAAGDHTLETVRRKGARLEVGEREQAGLALDGVKDTIGRKPQAEPFGDALNVAAIELAVAGNDVHADLHIDV